MTIDGTYSVTAQTPMGPETNPMTLKTSGAVLTGIATTPNGEENFIGTVNGNTAEWSSMVNTPMGLMEVNVEIVVEGDNLTGRVITAFGQFDMEGVRV